MEALPGHLERLPIAEDGVETEVLSRDHRDRILLAMYEIVAKRGYRGTSVELIVKRARVSRATFYVYFENRDACLLAGFAQAVEEGRELALPRVEAETSWPDQVRAGLEAFLEFVVASPARARTCLVETMTAGPEAMERYEDALRSFAPALARGRGLTGSSAELPETLEDSIIGGIVWMVHQRLLRGEVDEVPGLLPTMLEFALAPYVGEQQASELAAAA
jgi:AcrR family transcriptional regulator